METDTSVPAASADPERGRLPERATEPSDAALVRAMIAGSHDAVATLYDRHGGAVFAAAMRVNGDRWTSAEVVQETFLALWNRAEQFDAARGTLPAWLARIARNRAIDRARAAGRTDRALAFSSFAEAESDGVVADWLGKSGQFVAMSTAERGPEEAVTLVEQRASVSDALETLTPPERRVILLAYGDGLSQPEIAARTGLPLGTVKTQTRRALRRLREELERPRAPAGTRSSPPRAGRTVAASAPCVPAHCAG